MTEIKLKFFNPQTADKNMKATVHKTGKLGFTIEAAKKLALGVGKSFMIAINEADETDTNLYGMLYQEVREDSFKVYKAGNYYFLNLKPLLDTIKLDYKRHAYIYDISEETIQEVEMFVFRRRLSNKKDNIENTISN